MSSDRWQEVTEIFQAALELPAEDRGSFVRQACREDLKLRQAVESLLQADREAGEFMEAPLGSQPE